MPKVKAVWNKSQSQIDRNADYQIGESVVCFVNNKTGIVKRIVKMGNRRKYVVRFPTGEEGCYTRDELDYGNHKAVA